MKQEVLGKDTIRERGRRKEEGYRMQEAMERVRGLLGQKENQGMKMVRKREK